MVLTPTAYYPTVNVKTSSWRTSRPIIDYSKCTRCMICWKYCPDVAIDITDGATYASSSDRVKKMEVPVIDYDHCKGCGICEHECPFDAIEMVREGEEK